MKCRICKEKLKKEEKKMGYCDYCFYWKIYNPHKELWKRILNER